MNPMRLELVGRFLRFDVHEGEEPFGCRQVMAKVCVGKGSVNLNTNYPDSKMWNSHTCNVKISEFAGLRTVCLLQRDKAKESLHSLHGGLRKCKSPYGGLVRYANRQASRQLQYQTIRTTLAHMSK